MADLNELILGYTDEAKKSGVGYGFGNKDSSSGSVDCSGWVCETLNKAGIPVQGTAADLAKQAHEAGALSDVRSLGPGEVVFGPGAPHAKDRFNGIGHAGITVQKDGKLYVSESSSNGPTLTPVENWVKRYPTTYHTPATTYGQSQEQAQQQSAQPNRGPLESLASSVLDPALRAIGVRQDVLNQPMSNPMDDIVGATGRLAGRRLSTLGDVVGAFQPAGGQQIQNAGQALQNSFDFARPDDPFHRITGMMAEAVPAGAELMLMQGGLAPLLGKVSPALGRIISNVAPFAAQGGLEGGLPGAVQGGLMGSAFSLLPGGPLLSSLGAGGLGYLQEKLTNPDATLADAAPSAAFMAVLNAMMHRPGANPIFQGKEGWAAPPKAQPYQPSAQEQRLSDLIARAQMAGKAISPDLPAMNTPYTDPFYLHTRAGQTAKIQQLNDLNYGYNPLTPRNEWAPRVQYGERLGPVEQSPYSPHFGEVTEAAAPGVADTLQSQRGFSTQNNFVDRSPAGLEYPPGRGDLSDTLYPRTSGPISEAEAPALEAQLRQERLNSVWNRGPESRLGYGEMRGPWGYMEPAGEAQVRYGEGYGPVPEPRNAPDLPPRTVDINTPERQTVIADQINASIKRVLGDKTPYNVYGVPEGTPPLAPEESATSSPASAPVEQPVSPSGLLKAKLNYAYDQVEGFEPKKADKLSTQLDAIGYDLEQGNENSALKRWAKVEKTLAKEGISIPEGLAPVTEIGELQTAANDKLTTDSNAQANEFLSRRVASRIQAQAPVETTIPERGPDVLAEWTDAKGRLSRYTLAPGETTAGLRKATLNKEQVEDVSGKYRVVRTTYDPTGKVLSSGDLFDGTPAELGAKIARSNDPGLKNGEFLQTPAQELLTQHSTAQGEGTTMGAGIIPVPQQVISQIENTKNWAKELVAQAKGVPGPLTDYRDYDTGSITKVLRLPMWMAKQYPEMAAYRDISLGRVEKHQEVWGKAVRQAKDFIYDPDNKLTPNDRRTVERALIEGDKLGFTLKGAAPEDAAIEIDKWRQQLKRSMSPQAFEAYLGVRKALDNVYMQLQTTLEGLGLEGSELRQIMNDIGFRHEYFPRSWEDGSQFIMATDPTTGKTIRSTYKNLTERKTAYEQMKQAGYTDIIQGKNINIPEEAFFGVNPEHSARIAQAAIERLKGKFTPEEKTEVLQAITDSIRSRGFGQHFIEANDVQGYRTENLSTALNDYLHGAGAFIAKLEAAPQYYKMLSGIKANKRPELYDYANKLVKDVMSNQSDFSKQASLLRGLSFNYFLGGVVKSAFVNGMQNFITFAPYMTEFTRGATTKTVMAMKDIMAEPGKFLDLTKGLPVEFNRLSPEENQAVNDLFLKGALNDHLTQEVVGNLSNFPILNKVSDAMRFLFGKAESMNRVTAGLMAYRVFNGEKGLPHAEAVAKAENAIYDTHFLPGKYNLPEFARGGNLQEGLRSSGYQFKSFIHNYAELGAYMLKNNPKGLAGSLFTMAMLGGVTAMPIVRELSQLYTYFTGEDPLAVADKDNPVYTFLRYGVPGYLGADLSRSVALDVVQPDTPAEMATNLLFGPFVGLSQSLTKTYDHWQRGSGYGRVAEELSPVALRSLLKAYRESTSGVTTTRGQEVYDPNTMEQVKLSPAEAVMQAFSFKPTSTAERQGVEQQTQRRKELHQSKADAWASRFVNAYRNNDWSAIDEVLNKVIAWNETAVANGEPPIDLNKAVENRLKPKLPSKPWWNYQTSISGGG